MAASVPTIRAEIPRNWDALGREWEALEARAPRAPAFRRWAWVACLAEERFPDPVLLRLEGAGGETLGLALFNRNGRVWHLGGTGEAERDSPFVEHNGPLVAGDAPEGAEAALLRAAWAGVPGGGRPLRLVLGGVAPGLEAGAGGHPWRRQARPAPFVDLEAIRRAGGDWLATLSANTRQAIRRSDRALAEGGGAPPEAREAASEAEAAVFHAEMAELHRARFPGGGAYGTAWRARFQGELVRRQFRAGQLELLRVTAGGRLVGLLHNARAGGAVLAYQSGWAERPEGARQGDRAKPGLSCHHLAIARALARGEREYDFLAGDQRYKRSLAGELGGARELVWAERLRPGAVWGAASWLRGWLGRRAAPHRD